MTTFKNSIFSFVLAALLFASCNGQSKTEEPIATGGAQLSFTSKNTKLKRTQGTDEFQNVHSIIQDKNGNIWIATTGEGVYRYDGKEFTQYTEKDGLSNNKVWSIAEDNQGNIWFGTDNGVSKYDGKSISKIPLAVSRLKGAGSNAPTSSTNAVWCILQDTKDTLWFGSEDGMYCYDGKTFSNFLDDANLSNTSNLTLKSVQCLFEDSNGNIWFGSGPMAFEGICFYNGKSLINYHPLDEGWIRGISEDKNRNMLFTTRHIGLMMYDGRDFSDFPQPQNSRKDIFNTTLIDSKGNMWYGADYTDGGDVTTGGFWKYDGKTTVEFTKKDGLGNTAIYSLTEDRSGNIWIGTRNCGLYRYNGRGFEAFSE